MLWEEAEKQDGKWGLEAKLEMREGVDKTRKVHDNTRRDAVRGLALEILALHGTLVWDPGLSQKTRPRDPPYADSTSLAPKMPEGRASIS